ncbi:(2Fe-2S) ferredoxin domain-containing protein [Leptolyngbya boryana]|uniref:(2Fe-2S) ferredoxin domain-containing protein n=1 Tax=Leptolyngbya boryana TaxID=1184 RepID=UPI0021F1E587|nr:MULTISPECIES: (2Fe-2S) ferredoxin domain-containing protein [Leptolyngbya]
MPMSSKQVFVCQYQSCLAQGSAEVLAAFLESSDAEVSIVASGCQGQCNLGPTVRILPDEIWYCRVKPQDVETIVHSHLQEDHPVDRLLHPRFHPSYSTP